MPDLAQNMVVQTRIEWECLGQKDLTVWHWNVDSCDAGLELFSWLKNGHNTKMSLAGQIIDQLMAVMSDQMKCVGVVGQVIAPTRYHGIRTVLNQDGADASVVGTNNLALSVGYAPVLAGRGRMGRTQVPGLPQKYVVNGRWDPAAIAPIEAALVPFRTQQLNISLGSVRLGPILYSPATSFKNPIIDAVAYNTVRTMYRRTVGVGQ